MSNDASYLHDEVIVSTGQVEKLITLRYSAIPTYLHQSSFYEGLSAEQGDEDEIQIPANCFSLDDKVIDLQAFTKMLKVTAFWGLHRIPVGLISFCYTTEPALWNILLTDDFAELDFAQELMTIFSSVNTLNTPLVRAIQLQRTEVVEYLIGQNVEDVLAISVGAKLGRVDYITLLRQHGHPWNEAACEKAVEGGHLHCLQYLHQNRCPCDSTAAVMAASNGHIDCLKYLQDNNCAVDSSILIAAASCGQVAVLQHLYTCNITGNESTMYSAAEQGHLDCIQYLHEHDCPWDELAVECAAAGGHYECLRYLIEHGCPWNESAI